MTEGSTGVDTLSDRARVINVIGNMGAQMSIRITVQPAHYGAADVDPWKELSNSIDRAETLDQLAGAFVDYPRVFGFDYGAIIVLNEGQNLLLHQLCITSLPQRYRAALLCRDFLTENKVMAKIKDGAPLVLFPAVQGQGVVSENLAGERGQIAGQNGMAFPLNLESGLEAAVILTTSKSRVWIAEALGKFTTEIRGFGTEFLDAFVHLSRVAACQHAQLTEDEKRFLRLIATRDSPQVAFETPFAFGSAQTIQTSIARKLGVKTVYQALALAIRRQMLDLSTLCEDEIVHSQTKLISLETDIHVTTEG